MKRKTVSISIQGERHSVKGWGTSVPGVTLTALHKLGTGGQVEVGDTRTVVLVHDESGQAISWYQGGVKNLEKFVIEWAGGGVDWTGPHAEVAARGLLSTCQLNNMIQGDV